MRLRIMPSRVGLLLLVMLSVVLMVAAATHGVTPKYVHSLTVSRHADTPFTNANADGRFTGATALLMNLDGPCADEIQCCVQMSRSGDVGTFGAGGDGYDVITTQTELDWVFAQTGNFKVVTSAQNCCGVTGPILGCGVMGSHNTVILASAADDIWAHEFGHNQNLNHRDDCAQNIMHSTAPNTNSVNCPECLAFQAGGAIVGTCSFDPPTSVELVYFYAVGHEDHVEVVWVTANEIDNAGFNVYRATNEEGSLLRLNPRLVPADGDVLQGGTYSYSDYDVSPELTYYWLEDVDLSGVGTMHGPVSPALASIDLETDEPGAFHLAQNCPNPFSVATEIGFGLPAREHVSLYVFNVNGQKVRTLVDEVRGPGQSTVYWDGRDDRGSLVSGGIYFCRIEAGPYSGMKKMVMVK